MRMPALRRPPMIPRFTWVLLAAGVLVHPAVSRAQVTPSPTNSLTTAVGIAPSPLGGTQYNITDGTRPGGGPNLFHSFGGFSIGSNDIANFSNTRGPGIVNVLGRVTGGRSNISGLIQTSNFDITPPNLYLINPAGIMFGPGASVLNVSSFHVSTANYVRFPDAVLPDGTKVEVKFLATDSPLPSNGLNGPIINSLTANPIAFGFLGPNPVRIAIDGSSLQVSPGQTLSVVSGDAPFQGESQAGLRIAGPPQFTPDGIPLPTLGAPGGRIRIVSVASSGEVPIDSVDVGSFARLGQIDVAQTALIDVSGDPGGTVVIRGGRLNVDGGSLVFSLTGESPGANPGIDIWLNGDAVFTGGSLLQTATLGAGRAGDVVVTANGVEITGGASIQSLTIAGGGSGDIQVSAGPVRIDGFPSAISTSTFGSGPAGDVVLDVESLTLTAGANVGSSSSLTFDGLSLDGAGGNVSVRATGAVTISGVDPSGVVPSGITSRTSTGGIGGGIFISDALSLTLDQTGMILSLSDGTGAGGPINIDVGLLRVTGGATINTTSVGAAAGNVGVTVSDLAEISGAGSGLLSSSSFGRSGDLALDAGRISVAEGARIQSGSVFAGQGGNIALTGRDSITIAGRSGVSSQTFTPETVGSVTISTPALTIDDSFVSTSTLGAGPAGRILLDVGTLTMTQGAHVESSSEVVATGAGGEIVLTATGSVTLAGSSPFELPSSLLSTDPSTGIFSTASGSGAGGDLSIQAAQLQLLDGATISAKSTGTKTALAGNVNIVAGSLLRMVNSTITTESMVADGGNISITTTGSTLRLTDSQITTSVQGGIGQGGNITIGSLGHPFEFILLGDSQIRADAFGGPGGNINIFADVYLTSASVVSASSALSTPGTIAIEATVSDVSGSLTQLPTSPLEAAALMRASCAARLAGGKASSLVVAGREGLPLDPSGLLPSPLVEEPPVAALAPNEEFPWLRSLLWVSYLSLDPKCLP